MGWDDNPDRLYAALAPRKFGGILDAHPGYDVDVIDIMQHCVWPSSVQQGEKFHLIDSSMLDKQQQVVTIGHSTHFNTSPSIIYPSSTISNVAQSPAHWSN